MVTEKINFFSLKRLINKALTSNHWVDHINSFAIDNGRLNKLRIDPSSAVRVEEQTASWKSYMKRINLHGSIFFFLQTGFSWLNKHNVPSSYLYLLIRHLSVKPTEIFLTNFAAVVFVFVVVVVAAAKICFLLLIFSPKNIWLSLARYTAFAQSLALLQLTWI